MQIMNGKFKRQLFTSLCFMALAVFDCDFRSFSEKESDEPRGEMMTVQVNTKWLHSKDFEKLFYIQFIWKIN